MSEREIPPEPSARRAPSRNLIKRLYYWVLHWAETPYGAPALFILAFAESSCFPVPPDVLLIALCMGLPRRWLWFAFVCTAASVGGGLAGYGIGYFLRDSLGQTLLEWVGVLVVHGGSPEQYLSLAASIGDLGALRPEFLPMTEELQAIGGVLAASADHALTAYEKSLWVRGEALLWFNGPWGPWAVAVAGLTPIPYKLFTITAGMFEMDVLAFTLASILSRGARFFAVAAIIGLTYRFFGDSLQRFIDRYFNWLCIAFALLLVGGFGLLKLLH